MKCEDCKFWVREKDNFGLCHRFPPVTVGRVMTNTREQWEEFETGSYFPETHTEGWCGEFKHRDLEIPHP